MSAYLWTYTFLRVNDIALHGKTRYVSVMSYIVRPSVTAFSKNASLIIPKNSIYFVVDCGLRLTLTHTQIFTLTLTLKLTQTQTLTLTEIESSRASLASKNFLKSLTSKTLFEVLGLDFFRVLGLKRCVLDSPSTSLQLKHHMKMISGWVALIFFILLN